MKQTAVELLIDKLTESQFLWLSDKPEMNELLEIINQAIEMEKEQIVEAHLDGQSLVSCKDEYAELYYNETYKK
jgi:hypothetical protein